MTGGSSQKRLKLSSVNAGAGTNTGYGSNSNISVTLTNIEVLDCKICCKPLTIPVFQCKNGHAVCKNCLGRLNRKCPTYKFNLDIKCRPLEEIIESLKFPCKNKDYGCTDLISYCNRDEHEGNCIYESYPCKQSACHFRGSSNLLSEYFCTQHARYMKTFRYGHSFDLEMSKSREFFLLKEETTSSDLFVLNNALANCDGNKIRISSIIRSQISKPPQYSYELTAIAQGSVLKFSSVTHGVRSISDESTTPALLIIPAKFFSYMGLKTSKFCIQSCDEVSASAPLLVNGNRDSRDKVSSLHSGLGSKEEDSSEDSSEEDYGTRDSRDKVSSLHSRLHSLGFQGKRFKRGGLGLSCVRLHRLL